MRTTTVDQIVGDTQCGVIKIDVEGYEVAVLHGAAKTILRDSPNLVIKFDPHFNHLDLILDTLHELDYDPFYFKPMDHDNPHPTVAKIKEPCKECDPTYILCFPKGYDLSQRFHIFIDDLEQTGLEAHDTQQQLLADIINERPVVLNVAPE
jgi:hypothetical protein